MQEGRVSISVEKLKDKLNKSWFFVKYNNGYKNKVEQITRVNKIEVGYSNMWVNAFLYYLGWDWKYKTLSQVCMLTFKVTTKEYTKNRM